MANEYTSVNMAEAIAKIVATRAVKPLVGNLVMGNLVNRDFDPVLVAGGDTVNVPIPPSLTANNIMEAGTVTNQNPSLGNAQIVLNQHVEATFNVPDASKVLASIDLIDALLQPAIIAIATRMENDLLALYTLLTANAALGGASTFDESRLDSAETALANSLVPQGEPRYGVVSTSAYSAIRQLPRFSEFQMLGPSGQPSPIQTGAFPGGSLQGTAGGMLKGINWYRSQYVQTTSTTTYHNLVFARNAMALVIRRLPQPLPGTGAIAEYAELGGFGMRVVMSYAPNTLAQQFTVDCLYGVGILRNNHGVDVQST